jgi:hypothetical protein
MSNKTLPTTSRGCSCCGGGGGAGAIGGQPPGGASIIVRHKVGTVIGNVIREYHEQGTTIYELDDEVIQAPLVALSNNAPAVSEIGRTIDVVVFSGSITQKTYPIATRSLTPDPGGVDLTAPFTFEVLNVKRITPGIAELHTLSATDTEGTTSSKQSGVAFKHAFYQGYNTAPLLTEADIKSLSNKTLNDSIIQQYGGAKTYVVPGPSVPSYIYWLGPVGTPNIAGATLSGFALPLLDLAPVNVTNDFDGSIITSYWVKRTANLFDPGTYSIILS